MIARILAIFGAVTLAVLAIVSDGMAIPVLTVGAFLIAALGVAVYGLLKTLITPDTAS